MFYEVFKSLCEKNNTTPTTVAKKLELSTAMPTNWKKGQTPNGETLIKIADYFNVSVDFLLGRTNNVKEDERSISQKTTSFEKLSVAQRSMMKHRIYDLLVVHYQDDNFISNKMYEKLINNNKLIESSLRWFRLPQDYSYDNANIVPKLLTELNLSPDTLFDNMFLAVKRDTAEQLRLKFDDKNKSNIIVIKAYDVFQCLSSFDLVTVHALDEGLYNQITLDGQCSNPFADQFNRNELIAGEIASSIARTKNNVQDRM